MTMCNANSHCITLINKMISANSSVHSTYFPSHQRMLSNALYYYKNEQHTERTIPGAATNVQQKMKNLLSVYFFKKPSA